LENELSPPFDVFPASVWTALQQILDGLPTFVTLLNPDGEPQFANRQVSEYFDATLDEMKGWESACTVHSDDRLGVLAAWQRSVSSGEPYDYEARHRRSDGVYRWFHMRGSPLRDAEGRIILWYLLQTDVEDRKRAEEALRVSERNLNQTINTIPTLAWSALPDGSADFFNQHYLDYVGISTEQGRHWGWTVAVHPDDLNALAASWRLTLESDRPGECEARLRRYDGEYRWFLFRTNPFRNESGTTVKWYGTNTDINDRKRAEDELRHSEAHKTAILDSALDCIVTIDHEGRITEFNPAAERTFGHRQAEVIGKTMADVIIPQSLREQHWQGFARYLATGQARALGKRMEMTAVRADGTEFPIELAITRAPLDGPPSFTGFIRDLTESKMVEEQLRQSVHNLRQLTETIPEMLWSATPEGTIDYCNARVLDYTGFPAEEIQGNGWKDLLHPDDVDQAFREWISCVTTGAPYRVEVRTFHALDSTYRWCVTTALPLRDQHGHIVKWHGTIVDMHDWKQAQEELRTTQAELAHMMRVMTAGQLTASIAHEVSQPLAGIITNASTCLRMLAVDPPNVDGARETARRTIRDGNRASDIITKLRSLFEKKDVVTEAVDLNDAAREVIALSLSDMQRNEVILRAELADDLPPVMGDRVQLQQVILNLLLNASDAMSTLVDRPRRLAIRTEREEEGSVRLTVQDTGVGIAPKNFDQLFNPFYTTKSTGMGIGLSISRSIIEGHHGRLWAAANDGPGASFSFSIHSGPDGAAGTIKRNTMLTSATTTRRKP
jgi:PAS domain S-box-containing protein